MRELPIDHDSLFKELISNLFIEFLEQFAPEVAEAIEPDYFELLDKEMVADVVTGTKHEVDILAKVRLASSEAVVLVHVETQSYPQAEFGKRMLHYYFDISRTHNLPTYPIAIFSYDKPLKPEPFVVEHSVFGQDILRFQFKVLQLNQMSWREFAGTKNPAVVALMSKMQIPQQDRVKVRMEFLRLFTTLKLSHKKLRIIEKFMWTYLRLNNTEEAQLLKEIETTLPAEARQKYEQYFTSYEIKANEEGIAEGIAQGIQQSHSRIAKRILQEKFGERADSILIKVEQLANNEVEDLCVALFKIDNLEELETWLGAQR